MCHSLVLLQNMQQVTKAQRHKGLIRKFCIALCLVAYATFVQVYDPEILSEILRDRLPRIDAIKVEL